MSGRDHSIRIAQRLRAALESGRSLTYEDLAREAGCTVRSVRNYLADATATLGVDVRVERGTNRAMRVTLAESAAATVEDVARSVARDLLRRLFPIAGTSFDKRTRAGRVQAAVAIRGAYEYEEGHLRAMRAWIQAAERRPRVAVQLDYDTGEDAGPRIVWPIGILLRDAALVYLAGVPAEAGSGRAVHTYALHRVAIRAGRPSVRLISDKDVGSAPPGIDAAVVDDAIDWPFSIFPAKGPNAVHVHVVFSAAQAKYIRGRRWHRKQRIRELDDGGLEVRFGPADVYEAVAWVRQWGPSVTVVGDERLIAVGLEEGGPRWTHVS